MSTYLPMWDKIKALPEDALDAWIEEVAPATGREINFDGLKIIDIDLLEALRHWKNDIQFYGKAVLDVLPATRNHR